MIQKTKNSRLLDMPLRTGIFFAWLLLMAGCAQVNIQKVPTPTQYNEWTDKMQREADEIEGLRFYLPRPFLNVFESFPIRTDIYYAIGTQSADGKSVQIERLISEDGSRRIDFDSPQAIQSVYVLQPPAKNTSGNGDIVAQNASAATGGSSDNVSDLVETLVDASKPSEPVQSEPIQPSQPSAPVTEAPSGGTGTVKATSDNFAFAYQPMRGNFDIAYLPDFEEQYAIEKKEGLGEAKFEVNLGQGWSLQSFNSMVDNTQLTSRIFSVIDASVAAAKAATGFDDLLIGGMAAAAGNSNDDLVVAENNNATLENRVSGGADVNQPASFKIVIVHYAAKGLYPVIKPRELQQRSQLYFKDTFMTFDLFKKFPKPTLASQIDQSAMNNFLTTSTSYTVPKYPYQYISFNTFKYMAIELIDTQHKPFGNLYDKTGTTGDEGAANSGDLSALLDMLRGLGSEEATQTPSTTEAPAEVGNCEQSDVTGYVSKLSGGLTMVGEGDNRIAYNKIQATATQKTLNLNGMVEMVGAPELPNATDLLTVKGVMEANLKAAVAGSEEFKATGCQQVSLDLDYQQRVTDLINGELNSCEAETDEALITCALGGELPMSKCSTPLKLAFKSYDKATSTLQLEATPATALCKEFKLINIEQLEREALAHVRGGLEGLAPKADHLKPDRVNFSNRDDLANVLKGFKE